MVKYSELDTIFGALADKTRRDILRRLVERPLTVTEVAQPYLSEMSLPAVSKHLVVLEKASLIQRTKEGRTHHLRLNPAAMQDAAAWLDRYRRFWDMRLDALDALLNESQDSDDQSGG